MNEQSFHEREQFIATGSSAIREDLRDTLERRPALETINSSSSNPATTSPSQEISSPLSLPTSVEPTNIFKPEVDPIKIPTKEEPIELEDEGPIPEAIQNLHAGRPRKSHSRNTSLSANNLPSPVSSPLRSTYAALGNEGPSSASASGSPVLNRSNLPRSPFLYHQDHPSNHSNHYSTVSRSPSNSSAVLSPVIGSKSSIEATNNQSSHNLMHSPNTHSHTHVNSNATRQPKPLSEEEATAWELAEDFTQGASLFSPLLKLIQSGVDLLGSGV